MTEEKRKEYERMVREAKVLCDEIRSSKQPEGYIRVTIDGLEAIIQFFEGVLASERDP